jgi:hypothetical protein
MLERASIVGRDGVQGARRRAADNLAEAALDPPSLNTLAEQVRELEDQFSAEGASIVSHVDSFGDKILVFVRGALAPGETGLKLSTAARMAKETAERALPGAKVEYVYEERGKAIMALEGDFLELCNRAGVYGSLSEEGVRLQGPTAAIKHVQAAFTRTLEQVSSLLIGPDFVWEMEPTDRRARNAGPGSAKKGARDAAEERMLGAVRSELEKAFGPDVKEHVWIPWSGLETVGLKDPNEDGRRGIQVFIEKDDSETLATIRSAARRAAPGRLLLVRPSAALIRQVQGQVEAPLLAQLREMGIRASFRPGGEAHHIILYMMTRLPQSEAGQTLVRSAVAELSPSMGVEFRSLEHEQEMQAQMNARRYPDSLVATYRHEEAGEDAAFRRAMAKIYGFSK